MIAAALLQTLAWLAVVDVQSIPVDLARATCFVAALDADGPAKVFVLDGQTLSIHDRGADAASRTLTLPAGSGAMDVADIDGDGLADLIVVAGDRVLRFDLGPGASPDPELMLERANQFSAAAHSPRLHVLVVPCGSRACLALPTADALELHAPGEGLVESFPLGADAPHAALYGQPFRATAISQPMIGSPESLEFRVGSVLAFKPQLPEAMNPAPPGAEAPAYNPARRAREALRLPAGQWPTVALRRDAEPNAVAAYAISDGPPMETLVRVRSAAPRAEEDPNDYGPVRRFPGALAVTPGAPPDFDGDGHTDLLLWSAPAPSPTIANLSRATMRGLWPLHLAVHAYLPGKSRFDPRPWGRISVESPVAWFMAGGIQGPLRHVSLRDIDGDGRTDIGMAVAEDAYAIWFAGDGGFSARPDFTHRFAEPILGIAFEARLHGRRATALGLRGARTLHVLRAASKEAPDANTGTATAAPIAIGPAPAPDALGEDDPE